MVDAYAPGNSYMDILHISETKVSVAIQRASSGASTILEGPQKFTMATKQLMQKLVLSSQLVTPEVSCAHALTHACRPSTLAAVRFMGGVWLRLGVWLCICTK